jgi:hypothetical protein
MRVSIVLACISFGVLPLLLLNGQTFTNALITLTFFLVSTLLCGDFARDHRTSADQKTAWRLATTLTALLAIGIVLTLPSSYRFQKRFNQVRKAIHQAQINPHQARGVPNDRDQFDSRNVTAP